MKSQKVCKISQRGKSSKILNDPIRSQSEVMDRSERARPINPHLFQSEMTAKIVGISHKTENYS